jgi:ubiquitin-conjugating enzyme E2 W
VKELTEINTKGTPPGIVLLNAENMQEWIFLISVLGDETIYKVSFRPVFVVDREYS